MARQRLVSVLLPAVLLVSLLIAPASGAQSPEEAIEQELAGKGVDVIAVELGPGEVRVVYEHALTVEADPLVLYVVAIMDVAVQMVPQAERVIVDVDYLGEPLVQVVALAADIRAMLAGEMDPGALAEGLLFNERRTPERALRQNMALIGFYDPSLAVENEELHISLLVPDGVSDDEFTAMAIQILGWVADKTGGLQRTGLHAEFLDGRTVEIGVEMADVLAYRSGLTAADAYLSEWEIVVVEPTATAAGQPPTATPEPAP